MLRDVRQKKTNKLLCRLDRDKGLLEVLVVAKVDGRHQRVPVLVDLTEAAEVLKAKADICYYPAE